MKGTYMEALVAWITSPTTIGLFSSRYFLLPSTVAQPSLIMTPHARGRVTRELGGQGAQGGPPLATRALEVLHTHGMAEERMNLILCRLFSTTSSRVCRRRAIATTSLKPPAGAGGRVGGGRGTQLGGQALATSALAGWTLARQKINKLQDGLGSLGWPVPVSTNPQGPSHVCTTLCNDGGARDQRRGMHVRKCVCVLLHTYINTYAR